MRVWFLAIGMVAAFTAQALAANDARFFKSLEKLAPADRLEQLCDYTAMTEIRKDKRGFRPERAVANAGGETKINGHSIQSTNGAFRSKKKWYAMTYSCTATPDHLKVVSFKFTIGDEIPAARWAVLGLYL
ncbi:MAG: DUF930 domain-containing protein [Pseudolabrys sp.]|nr:DUF930 domain-containing protein [Pseudolabrys sp.]